MENQAELTGDPRIEDAILELTQDLEAIHDEALEQKKPTNRGEN